MNGSCESEASYTRLRLYENVHITNAYKYISLSWIKWILWGLNTDTFYSIQNRILVHIYYIYVWKPLPDHYNVVWPILKIINEDLCLLVNFKTVEKAQTEAIYIDK